MGKKSDLSEFDRGRVVGARRAGLSVSAASSLLGFSRSTVSRVFRDWTQRRAVSTARHGCGRKCLVDDGGRRKLDRLIQGDREASVAELTARYNHGTQKTISERTTRRVLKRLGYSKAPLGTAAKPTADTAPSAEDGERAESTQAEQKQRTEAQKVDHKLTDRGWQV